MIENFITLLHSMGPTGADESDMETMTLYDSKSPGCDVNQGSKKWEEQGTLGWLGLPFPSSLR